MRLFLSPYDIIRLHNRLHLLARAEDVELLVVDEAIVCGHEGHRGEPELGGLEVGEEGGVVRAGRRRGEVDHELALERGLVGEEHEQEQLNLLCCAKSLEGLGEVGIAGHPRLAQQSH